MTRFRPPSARHRHGIALLAAILAAAIPAAASLHGQASPGSTEPPGPDAASLLPDTVLAPPGGPRIVRLPAPGAPLVSLRLSVPIREAAVEAGAGRVLQMLGTERATSLARPVGATVEGTRTPWGVAYTVTGAAADIDFLAYLLREAVRDPSGRQVDFRQAVAALEVEAHRREETPGGRVVARLRTAVAPASPPLGGTLGSLRRLTMADLRAVWARTHQAAQMTLVVAGDVPLEIVLASVQGLGAPAADAAPAPTGAAVSEPAPPRLEVIRHWYGEARPVDAPQDPRVEVAALLVAERLHAVNGDFEAEVQLWQLPDVRVLAVVGAAYAAGRQQMRTRLRSILADTAEGLTAATVERAATRVEADLRMRARTPGGRTGLMGLHLDATGEIAAARDFLATLKDVDVESMRSFLEVLAAAEPQTAEVRP